MTTRDGTHRDPETRAEQRAAVHRGITRMTVTAVVVIAAVAWTAGCGGSAATPPSPTGATSASQAQSAQAAPTNPPAPEINPAGDIPDSQVFVPFTATDGAFVVSVPQGWARTAQGPATLFSDKFNSVRIEQAAAPAPIDVASVRTRDLPALARAVPAFTPGDVRQVERTSGPAVLATYSAASAANPVTGKSVAESVERYSFWRGGREVVLTLSGPAGADNVDPWRKVTDSFRWLR